MNGLKPWSSSQPSGSHSIEQTLVTPLRIPFLLFDSVPSLEFRSAVNVSRELLESKGKFNWIKST